MLNKLKSLTDLQATLLTCVLIAIVTVLLIILGY